MKEKNESINNQNKNKAEIASEMSAKDLSWELFKMTGDTKYYQLYSALKEKDEKKSSAR